ncbi:DUF2382 domain-containing protein [Kovacikia minuta CCNUW1]|uniref:DUF2382 domain-containing protein n=1 Tax=Kovacikia minuta TaxID=2931930 RepID=UPI001CC90305|nr:DUF2382 domain-containing protein [Kovacikia minuta]UBF26058.1 DUF2382 domain-containing protein [Kovacikia minuta CCNUW1]
MALHKIKDFDPDYRQHFDDNDVIGYALYSGDDKLGSVDDILVDDGGNFRYLVVNTGLWILGKKVLLPIGRARISHPDHRIYVSGLSKEQVENMPAYDSNAVVDYDHEERIRETYRPVGIPGEVPVDSGTSVNSTADDRTIDRTADRAADRPIGRADYDRSSYSYDRDPALYEVNDRDHQNLRLYQERLIANRTRQKTGEVSIGKHVETETQRVSVPVEKERVVVERTNPTDIGRAVAPGEASFHEGEVARVEVYEETPDIRKEAFVREEVNVRKEVDRDTVDAEEQLRREELDIDTKGRPVVNKRPNERI